MPLKKTHLERQYQQATEKLDKWVSNLDEKGVAPEKRKKDPIWRSLKSQCRTVKNRMIAAAAVVTLDEELKAKKTAKASAVVVEEEPKAKKTKKEPKKTKADKKAEAIEESKSKSAKSKPPRKKASKN